jgi:hypothetical protein
VTGRRLALVVDPGVDDALALLVAARHPALRLDAVVATAGNVPLGQAAANARLVLQHAGVDVPLGRGSSTRMDGTAYPPRPHHGSDGLGGAAGPPWSTDELAALPAAPDLLATLPGDVLVVCLAPLTCLVGLPRRQVVASYAGPGEPNQAMDPEAAAAAAAGHDLRVDPPPPATRLAPGSTRGLLRHLLLTRGERGPGDAATVLRLAL